MSRSLNHGYENECSKEVFNEIYNMAFARGKESGIDEGKAELSAKIMEYIHTSNRNNADYFIVDQIEKLCSEYIEDLEEER